MSVELAEEQNNISEILFNLSSADRLILLSSIHKKHQRLNELAKVINASPQECSRHLARLDDSGFISKDSQGYYAVTPLGKAILDVFPSIQFLLKFKEYFLTHDLSFLPQGYSKRIGELSACKHLNHFSLVLEHLKTVLSTAKEFVYIMSDQPIVAGSKIGSTFYSKDVPVRLIGDQTVDRQIVSETKSTLPRSEISALPTVSVALAINETVAGVCFPNASDNKIDFSSGFSGTDPVFRAWCEELFQYYWSKSRRL
jgi:predicted transcriptional regulator